MFSLLMWYDTTLGKVKVYRVNNILVNLGLEIIDWRIRFVAKACRQLKKRILGRDTDKAQEKIMSEFILPI